MTILLYSNAIQLWHIILTALITGFGMAFNMPSRQAIIPELVDKDHLMNGIALYAIGSTSCRIIGPTMSGLLIGLIGVNGVFLVTTILYIIVVTSMWQIKPSISPVQRDSPGMLADFVEGIRYLYRRKDLLTIVALEFILAFIGASYISLLPIFAGDILKLDAAGYGFLSAAAGTGSLTTAVSIASVGEMKRKGGILLGACLLFGLCLVAFSNSILYALSILTLLFVGIFSTLCLLVNQTVIQSTVDNEIRGRITSLFVLMFGMDRIGAFPIGAAANVIGAPLTVTICGSIVALASIVISLVNPAMKKL
jgi:MFS family permease